MLDRRTGTGCTTPSERSDDADAAGFVALAARSDLELDALTLLEGLVALALDLREVHEHVVAVFARDEPVTLFSVEELHRAVDHSINSFSLAVDHMINSILRPRD